MDQDKIGKFIAEKRKLKKITQSQLAEKLGVTDRTISNWENGKNMPDLSLFKPLCNILEITVNELISGENITAKEYNKKLEENFINTINYIDKKQIKNNNIKHIGLLIIGIIGLCSSQFNISNYEIQNYVNVICVILTIYSVKQLFIKHIWARKVIAIILIIICILSLLIK